MRKTFEDKVTANYLKANPDMTSKKEKVEVLKKLDLIIKQELEDAHLHFGGAVTAIVGGLLCLGLLVPPLSVRHISKASYSARFESASWIGRNSLHLISLRISCALTALR